MKPSDRVIAVGESVTLKLNEKASRLAEQGKTIYNLTAGQLPVKPPTMLVDKIGQQLNLLKSYQYAPVAGVAPLREKVLAYLEKSRNIELSRDKFSCVISDGAKHSVFNVLGSLINPEDEVLLLTPYWISYPEMVKVWGGKIKVVDSNLHNGFVPSLDTIRDEITDKTKVIIVNSPNNPAGTHYPEKWMREFADLLIEFPHVNVISDEIYFELSYYDPKPCYFYQFKPELLDRTIIIDGISKSFASTGLRIGYCVGPKNVMAGFGKLQSQSTSGASSLIQRALVDYGWEDLHEFLVPINEHLRKNADRLKKGFSDAGLISCWYQPSSAFYFLLDFSTTPYYRNKYDDDADHSVEICEQLLEEQGIAIVPATDFGLKNSARISLVSEDQVFTEALAKLIGFLE